METFLLTVHIFVSITLILIVLIQTGKGAEMGAAFGGAAQTVFGGSGPAPLLGKITTFSAVIFMVTSQPCISFSQSNRRIDYEGCEDCCSGSGNCAC